MLLYFWEINMTKDRNYISLFYLINERQRKPRERCFFKNYFITPNADYTLSLEIFQSYSLKLWLKFTNDYETWRNSYEVQFFLNIWKLLALDENMGNCHGAPDFTQLGASKPRRIFSLMTLWSWGNSQCPMSYQYHFNPISLRT